MANLIPFNKRNPALLSSSFPDFRNMLDDFFSDSINMGRNLRMDTFKIDIQDNENEYIVEAELPGVEKDEINLSLEDGKLNISFSKEESIDESDKNYIHKERQFSAMSRNVYLADADPEGINAKLNNGVLSVTIAKKVKPDTSISIDIE